MSNLPRIAVLMAGGVGRRLWPASTEERPKQFLRLEGDKSLLQQAWERAQAAGVASTVVVTGKTYQGSVMEHLPRVAPEYILGEPAPLNTGPALALAAGFIQRVIGDAAVLVLPADHAIPDVDAFAAAAARALAFVEDHNQLLTFGITPTRPETGYGYIELGPVFSGHVYQVSRFVEKPAASAALGFLQSGRYLWNSGMFVWRNHTFIDTLRLCAPQLHALSQAVAEGADWVSMWHELPSVSVDYAVMEKAKNVVVMRASFAWDDLGSWLAVRDHLSADSDGNVIISDAPVAASAASNNIIYTEGLPVAVLGTHDAVVAATPRGVLVAGLEELANIKTIIEELNAQHNSKENAATIEKPIPQFRFGQQVEPATLKTVEKPWGREVWWALTDGYCAKVIEVKRGHALSLQYHKQKVETMLFLQGSGFMRVNSERRAVYPGMVVHVEPGTVHRVWASTDLLLVEVSTTELDDVVRLADEYGRE